MTLPVLRASTGVTHRGASLLGARRKRAGARAPDSGTEPQPRHVGTWGSRSYLFGVLPSKAPGSLGSLPDARLPAMPDSWTPGPGRAQHTPSGAIRAGSLHPRQVLQHAEPHNLCLSQEPLDRQRRETPAPPQNSPSASWAPLCRPRGSPRPGWLLLASHHAPVTATRLSLPHQHQHSRTPVPVTRASLQATFLAKAPTRRCPVPGH